MNKWGFHLMLDVYKACPASIRDYNHIKKFSKELVNKIDMIPFGEPQIIMFGDGNKKGYTLVQLIETSNITAHFCEEDNNFYLDVFSCKPYNNYDVIDITYKYFKPVSVKTNYIERNALPMV